MMIIRGESGLHRVAPGKILVVVVPRLSRNIFMRTPLNKRCAALPTSERQQEDPVRRIGADNRRLQDKLLVQAMESICLDWDSIPKEVQPDKMKDLLEWLNPLLAGINPQDEIEGLLTVQMIGIHNASLEAIRRAMSYGQHPEAVRSYMNLAGKLARTFTQQLEALKRYRSGGQQKVMVEHVHVNQGGQAVIGTINRGEGRRVKK